MDRVQEHYNESLRFFPKDRIVGIFYQGSGNYGLDYEDSDVDTKLIVVPSFEDIATNNKPVSTTHIRENEEHIDFKDVRLYIQTFKKQNLNFLEILYTPYFIINPLYESEWNRLVERREEICRYSPFQSIKSMQGIAKEKYFAMEHHYPSRMEWIQKFGYDPKQLHHLLRVEEYITRYLAGEKYSDCLQSKMPNFLVDVKKGKFNLDEAREIANASMYNIDYRCHNFLAKNTKSIDESIEGLFNEAQCNIMRIAIRNELMNENET